LELLGFPDEAFCAIEALMPRETSIINVKALKGILDAGNDTVRVRSPSGTVCPIPRPHLTAIVAELVMQIKDHPWPFFDHTDLLDFPGARTREMNN
ncbi:virulence factor SrfC family protein, partial [Acinetobacter baumannii]